MATKIQFRRDTAANWASNNPTLSQGEMGLELDTGKFKVGNGTSAWTALSYASGVPGRGITSVNRTSGNGSAGTTDTYTITYSDSTTSTFTVYNGANSDVTSTNTVTLTNKTLSGAILNDGYTEEIYALSGTTPALNPANGSIQTWTLTGNSSPTDSLGNGQSIFLGITASSYTVTWPSVTWSKVGGSGTAPTLTSSGVNWIVLWKVGGTLRGAFLGTA